MILANIAYKGVKESQAVVAAGCLKNLINILDSKETQVRLYATWTLMNLSGILPTTRSLMLDLDVVPKLLPWVFYLHFFFHSFFTDAERLVIITYRCNKQHDLISCVKVIGEYTH